jgi:aminomethyltransferase
MKRTPLFAAHQELGGRLIEFGGWEMPVQYTSIVDEHLAVRRAAGLFDISHMGEISVEGPQASAFLNRVLTNDLRKVAPGQGQYTLMCNERGGAVDDLYAYRFGEREFLLIVNASRTGIDAAWLEKQLAVFEARSEVSLRNVSEQTGAIAVQGPKVIKFIGQIFPGASEAGTTVAGVSDLKKNHAGAWRFQGDTVWVARTGYTGEDGFEAVAPNSVLEALWNKLLDAGLKHGLKPAGLGARDTLRTEVCYPLYGHELDENTTPIEAGLGFFVALDKGEFVGRSVLVEQKAKGVKKKLAAFKMTEKSAPPRPEYPVWSPVASAGPIGKVVSGTQSPSLGIGIGMAYVPPEMVKAQTPLEIEIRGRRAAAVVSPKPLYKRESNS